MPPPEVQRAHLVVMQAMAIEPADRYPSVGAMVEALAHAVLGRAKTAGDECRAMAVCIEISTPDEALREQCIGALQQGLLGMGFVIAVTAPDSMLAARPEPSASVAAAVVGLLGEQCLRADIHVAIGIGNAVFSEGGVDAQEWRFQHALDRARRRELGAVSAGGPGVDRSCAQVSAP